MVAFLPLPRQRRDSRSLPELVGTANRGLIFAKFADLWNKTGPRIVFDETREESGRKRTGKAGFLQAFAGAIECDEAARAAERIARLAGARGGRAETFVTIAPFVTGIGLPHAVENGFLWHHTLGVPYLPGSGVKGLLRSWVRDWAAVGGNSDPAEVEALVTRLFGTQDRAGALVLLDALPVRDVVLVVEVLTPHDAGWRLPKEFDEKKVPADWVSPKPIPFLAVAPGQVLQFAVAPRPGAAAGDIDLAFDHLREALDWLGAGAKTASGFGRFGEPERPLQVGDVAVIRRLNNVRVVIEGIDGDLVDCANADDRARKYRKRPLSDLSRP